MNQRKRWCAFWATVLLLSQLTVAVSAVPEIPFTDVPSNEWYYADVRNAYNMALIDGRSATTFAPNDLLTFAEAVKLAACMYQVYTDDAPFVVTAEPWYQIYADYCYENGIIHREYNWNQNITRGEYMDIFSRALPKEALLAVNSVDDGMIPDVPMSYRYAQSIYKLYRAGIVRGQDTKGSCAPDSFVKRSEVAAILTRMMDKTKRVSITLEDPSLRPKDTTAETTAPVTPPVVPPSQPSTGGSIYYPIIVPGTGSGGWVPGGNTGGSSGNTGSGSVNTGGNSSGTVSGGNSGSSTTLPEPEETMPWDIPGAKKPSAYTWDEYALLTENQKRKFQQTLGADGFEIWRDRVMVDMGAGGDTVVNNPWEIGGAKQPGAYTWDEYEQLSYAQQAAFRNYLGEISFENWKKQAQNGGAVQHPWEIPGAKQPSQYSYAEYNALTPSQQMAFQNVLGVGFDAWLQNARGGSGSGETLNPWEVPGAMQPSQYTYAEFNALSPAQQIAFQNVLGAGFDAWLQSVQCGSGSGEATNPWEDPGAKPPSQYTYAEFNALTPGQQMAFQNVLGVGFDAWLQNAQGGSGSEEAMNPWEVPGAKQPSQYTYAEFNALSSGQQMAFQNVLGAGFDAWLQSVQGGSGSGEATNPWEVPGAKQPSQYTYAEFNALSPAQQMAFQNVLGADFDVWLQSMQGGGGFGEATNPWDVPGAKQPHEYTYAEFNELSLGQQMAFQRVLGEAGFETWLNANLLQ